MTALVKNSITLLDGALGTELERRGCSLPIPLWSAYALMEHTDLVVKIHQDYVQAGCDVLTAATFRTAPYTFKKVGLSLHKAEYYTNLAIQLARTATKLTQRTVKVAGSVAPLEDCYQPERTPSNHTLFIEHQHHIENLVKSGCDVILIETMPTVREAIIATRIALQYNLPVWVSLQTNKDGTAFYDQCSPNELLQLCILPIQPEVISLNCSSIVAQFQMLLKLSQLPFKSFFGCYPNVGKFDSNSQWSFQYQFNIYDFIDQFAKTVALIPKLKMIGGCCGTTPEHISYLRDAIDRKEIREIIVE
ncbi:MAG: homocysteine S-methyltransferase family protein [bacterium]|nr:homocysteine S-methyltransferase family protein [bacterium]